MASLDTLTAAPDGLCTKGGLAYARRMEHAPDDSALMLRYQDGDLAAFEVLYKRHNDALYRYLLRLCRSRDAAEDVFQEVWGKIIKSRSTYRPSAKFSTFLYRVAHNCFIDHLRRNKRHSHYTELNEDQHSDGTPQPDSLTERSLAREKLSRALLALPDEQRDAFLLHEEAGLSIDQIAAVTGSKPETAKSRIRYATQKLRQAIDEPREPT
ncbi:MAG: RNA polymerase sigma factor [Gammaproteobacteria bacterium]|nr:RNA polymerase sigma factor [Gammaproteobacteria bacterium]